MRDLFNVFNARGGSLERITFDQFLVGISTCFVEEKQRDAVKIMFNANAEESDGQREERHILKSNIVKTYQRGVDQSHFDGDGYGEWKASVRRMESFGDTDDLWTIL